jgi:protein phosphatase
MEIVGRTDRGRLRRRNEDWVALDEELGLALLADGMGGLVDGHVASREAVAAARGVLHDALASGEPRDAAAAAALLSTAVAAANQRVRDLAAARGGVMGTTLEILWLDAGGTCRLAHVGDSRAYHWRAGELELLTRDHSLVQDLVERGHLDAQDARRSPQRNVITRAVGLEGNLEPALVTVELGAGELLLLCSDGLWDMLEDARIAGHLARCGAGRDGLAACADALVQHANEAGGLDNVSVVLARGRRPGG